MKKRGLIIVFLFVNVGVWAQRDYRKGYIITNEQDTVYGWVDYQGDAHNAKVCSFKKSETDYATEYMPNDIAAYRFIYSKYYISKNIGTKDNPKQVFLEYLVNGLAKFYYYRDENTNEHYYIENNGHFIELKLEEKEAVVNGTNHIEVVNPYIGVLKTLLNEPEMYGEINRTKLERGSLINLAKDYQKRVCTDGTDCIVYEKEKPVFRLRLGPMVGGDLSTFKFGENPKYNFTPSSNFSCGVNLNISMPRITEKLFLQVHALYTKYYFFSTYRALEELTDTQIQGNILQTGLAIKYEYPKKRWRPTIAAGAAGIFLPDLSVKEVSDIFPRYHAGEVYTTTNTYDFPKKIVCGIEVIPGIHYHLTKGQILFFQLQYLCCFRWMDINFMIQSFGLSAGIYL